MDKKEGRNIKTKTPQQAFSSLARLCSRAEKSSGDARRLMARWGVEAKDREEVIKRLIDTRFIDDHRYTRAYINEKMNLNGWGPRKISYMLRSKGISGDIIAAALSERSPDEAGAKLEQKLTRKYRSLKDEDPYKKRDKILRYGTSLGFDFEEVIAIADRIIAADKNED